MASPHMAWDDRLLVFHQTTMKIGNTTMWTCKCTDYQSRDADHCCRCVDQDMFMRYLGGGIGHRSHTAMDTEWEDVEDELEMPDAVNEEMDDAPDNNIELPNEEDYNQDGDSNEQVIQEGELEDYEYTKDDEDLDDDEDMLEEVDGDDLGPEDGEDYEELDAEYDYDD